MYMISTEFAAILQKMAREYQQNPTISRRGEPNELNFRVGEVFLAKVTTEISASSGESSPGTGEVELYTPDPADTGPIEDRGYVTLDEPVDRSAAQPWTYTATTVDVTNPFDSTFAVDSFLLVMMIRGQWVPVVGGSGGGASGSCCCDCVSVDPNLIHPTGDFLTVRDWDVTLENDTDWARNDADGGDVRVQSGTYTLSWDTTDERWEYTLTVSDIDFRDDDGNISVPSAVTGQIYLEWVSTSEPVLLRIDFDGDE